MILYICDRCGDKTSDSAVMKRVQIIDVVARTITDEDFSKAPMLCPSCIQTIRARMIEKLPAMKAAAP